MTLKELLLNRYAPLHDLSEKTVRLYGWTIDRLEDFLEAEEGRRRDATTDDLTDLTVVRFLRWRAKTPHNGKVPSHGSVLKDRTQLVAIATYAARKRLIAEFLELPKMRPLERIPRAYTHAEVQALVRHATIRVGRIGDIPARWFWMTLPWAAWLTAERINALLSIRWQDVDLERRAMLFRAENRKGHTRDIERSITQQLADLLGKRQGLHQPSDLVWPWVKHRTKGALWSSLRILCKTSGVTYRGFHGFRRSSASYLTAAGGDATEHLDHDRPSTTKKSYLDPSIVRRGPSAADLLPPLDLSWERPEDGKPPEDESGGPGKPR